MITKENVELFADYLGRLISKTDKLSWASSNDTVMKTHAFASKHKYPVAFVRTFAQYFMTEYWHRVEELEPGQVLHVHSKDVSFRSVMLKSGVPSKCYPPFLYFQIWGDGAMLVKRGFNMDWRVFWSHNDCRICYYRCVLPYAESGRERMEEGVFVSPSQMSGVLEEMVSVGHPIELQDISVIQGWFGYGETQREARLNALERKELDEVGAMELLKSAGFVFDETEQKDII